MLWFIVETLGFFSGLGKTEEMLDSENQQRVEGLASKVSMLRNVSVELEYVPHISFYAPGLKGQPGASSVWIVRLSVRLSVCLCIILSRFQTKCNILSVGGHTVNKLGL